MKRLTALFISIVTAAVSLLPAVNVKAAAPNLVANPSAETSTNGVTPDGFATGKWGTNNAAFSWAATGHTGTRSVKVQMTSYTDGDAKWYFTPINVTAGQKYNLSEWYHATVPTGLFVQFDNGTDYQYLDLGTKPAVAPWTQVSDSFTVPAGFTHATIFHVLSSVGILQTDDYKVSPASDLSVNITSPTSGSVNGSVPLSAAVTSTSGVSGVQFKVDGVNAGSEITSAPYQMNWDSTTVSNGPHTITATAHDSYDGVVSSNVAVTVNNAIADGANLVPNAGVETISAADKNLPDKWTHSSWGTNDASFRYLVNGVHSGARSLKVSITNYTDGDAKWYFDPQVVEPGRTYSASDYYKSNTESYMVADFHMSDGSDQYVTLGTLSPASGWTKFEQQFAAPDGATTVTIFHLLNRVGWLLTDDYTMQPYSPVGFNRALVSLTFDDAWASVYNNALPLLQQYGFHSTQYMLSGNTADPDYMTVAMMQAMKNAGEEIASHTVDHADLITLTAAQQKAELNDSKNSLQTWTGASVTNFASPYGSIDQNTIAQIKKYYSSHRGVVAGYNSKNYFNIWDIKVQDVTSTTTLAQVQAWIAKAQATNTWLVLVYHQVSDSPDAGDYNTTPAQLNSHFAAMQSSGIAVVTVGRALAEIQPQL